MSAINYRYNTRSSYEGQKGKSNWTFSNKGAIPGHEATADFNHSKDFVIDKMSSSTGPYFQDLGNGNFNYKDSDVTVDKKDGVIYYAVVLKVPQGTTGDMVLTDTLPAGLTYKSDSAFIAIYGSNNDATRNYSDGKGELVVKASDPQKQSDGSSKVNFTVTGYRPGDAFILYYQATVEDEAYWKDQTKTDKDYSNKIEWKSYSDTTKTHVEQNKKVLDKTHQLKENADGTRQLIYYLKVNRAARDIDPDSDTLILTDTLKTDDSGAKPYFDPTSIKVYQYDPDMANGVGAEIDHSRYTYQYNEGTHKLTIKIPDQLACVVSYQYNVTVGVNDTIVSNSAELTGVAGSSTSDVQKLTASSSSSTVQQNTLILYKVDSEDYRVKLSGVTFRVEEYSKYENNQHIWTTVNGKDGNPVTKTTDQNGVIKFTTIDDNLKTNTLYRLVETDVGNNPGYAVSNTPYMFIWKDAITYKDNSGNDVTIKDPTKNDYWDHGILPSGATNIDRDKVELLDGTGNVYYPNEKNAVSVNKVWLNSDNKDLNDPSKKATVRLYRKTAIPDGYKVTVNVSFSGGTTLDPYVFYINKDSSEATIKLLNVGPVTYNGTMYNAVWSDKENANLTTIPINGITGDTVLRFSTGWGKNATSEVEAVYKKPDSVIYGNSQYIDSSGNVVGSKTDADVVLSSDNEWHADWYGLDKTDSTGEKYYYYVEEDTVEGFTTTITNNGINNGTITVVNKSDNKIEYSSFDFTKQWENPDKTTDWKQDITVTLTGKTSSSTISNKFTIRRNENGSFTATRAPNGNSPEITTYSFAGAEKDGAYQFKFDNLPQKDESGNVYQYTMTEDTVKGYTPGYVNADGTTSAGVAGISTGGVIKNTPSKGGAVLPFTGGSGTGGYLLAGLALIAAAAALYLYRRRHLSPAGAHEQPRENSGTKAVRALWQRKATGRRRQRE